MKKIFSYAFMMVSTVLAFASCADDNDSNPTLLSTPGEFVINAPKVGDVAVDLKNSESVNLTWSQPQFTTLNAPVVADYELQVSTTGTFEHEYDASAKKDAEDYVKPDYATIDETYKVCNVDVPTSEIAKALEKVEGWEDGAVPAEQKAYIRVRAFIQNANKETLVETFSNNIVSFNSVPYYVELKNADPLIWYLIGGVIGDGSWGSAVPTGTLPMQTIDGEEYDAKTGYGKIQWIGYIPVLWGTDSNGNPEQKGFKLKQTPDSWDYQWGQGADFGQFVKNNGGSGNINVPTSGYYKVTLTTGDPTDASAGELKVEAYTEDVREYESICIAGDINGWSDDPMDPVFTYTGAINHDWTTTITVDGTQGIKFKIAGSWDANWGGSFSKTEAGDCYGIGSNGGANITLPAGTYTVVFNDITGFYRFIKSAE